jgi:hypothetical protein
MARTPIHPGEILGDEFEEIGLSAKKLADVIQPPLSGLGWQAEHDSGHGSATGSVLRHVSRILDEPAKRL